MGPLGKDGLLTNSLDPFLWFHSALLQFSCRSKWIVYRVMCEIMHGISASLYRQPLKQSVCLSGLWIQKKWMLLMVMCHQKESGEGLASFLSPRGQHAAQVISHPLRTLGIWLQMAPLPPPLTPSSFLYLHFFSSSCFFPCACWLGFDRPFCQNKSWDKAAQCASFECFFSSIAL